MTHRTIQLLKAQILSKINTYLSSFEKDRLLMVKFVWLGVKLYRPKIEAVFKIESNCNILIIIRTTKNFKQNIFKIKLSTTNFEELDYKRKISII